MTSANLPEAQVADKKLQVPSYMTDEEVRIVGLAAVESKQTRSGFVAEAAIEKAVEILKQKNPSALDGTPYELAKSA